MVSIGPLNPVSGSVASSKVKVTGVTSWGVLRDGLLSPFLTYGAQKNLYVCVSLKESSGCSVKVLPTFSPPQTYTVTPYMAPEASLKHAL